MRILVVDDDPGALNAIRVGLLSLGYEVFIARSGEDALEIIHSVRENNEQTDLLLTDLWMPGISGLELIHSAREIMPGIRAIIMTAYGDDHVQTKIRELGNCGYVEKPFQPWVLARMIEEARSSEIIPWLNQSRIIEMKKEVSKMLARLCEPLRHPY
jgi:two-component system, cell cycle sensor histidine kinase and response regulator CckA